MMKKSGRDNYRADDIGKIELEKFSMLSLIVERDGRTQTDLAAECRRYKAGQGITQSVLSEYINESRRPTEAHARVIAHVLGVKPKHLGRRITKEELVRLLDNSESDIELEGGPVVSEPAVSPATYDATAERHLKAVPAGPDYSMAEANGLIPVLSLAEGDGQLDQSGIPIWDEAVAATSWASNDPTGDVSFAWVPAHLWKLHGAELRAITVAGRSMEKAGISPGDVLLVRQTSDPKRAQNEIVIAASADGMTVKRLKGRALVAESNLDIRPIPVGRDAKLKGVVVGIHKRK